MPGQGPKEGQGWPGVQAEGGHTLRTCTLLNRSVAGLQTEATKQLPEGKGLGGCWRE